MEADWPKGRAPQVQRVHKVHLLLQSSESESRSVVSDSLQPCIVHGTLQTRTLEWYHFPSPGDLSNPGIKPRSPTLEADALTSEPQGKHNYHNGKQSQNSTLAEDFFGVY